MSQVDIRTRDGVCRSYLFRPAGSGPFPAVVVYMDGVGIRPTVLAIGERLATHGYVALVPDLFYRAGPYEPMDARAIFADPARWKALREKFGAHVDQARVMSDTEAFLDFLAAQPGVKAGPVGVIGYCMGGRMALTAAGTYPERVAAAAAFHPGGVATDAPDSPHLLAPRIKARVYIAGASEDASFPEDMKARLAAALAAAGVDHVLETYPARHGWTFPDTPVYDAAATERHWGALLGLLQARL